MVSNNSFSISGHKHIHCCDLCLPEVPPCEAMLCRAVHHCWMVVSGIFPYIEASVVHEPARAAKTLESARGPLFEPPRDRLPRDLSRLVALPGSKGSSPLGSCTTLVWGRPIAWLVGIIIASFGGEGSEYSHIMSNCTVVWYILLGGNDRSISKCRVAIQ